MNLKDVSIGFTHALNKGIPEIDERAIRNEELGMRKDTHALQLRKAQREEELLTAIKGHVDEYRNAVANLPPGPAIGGGVPQQQSPTSVQQSPTQSPTLAPTVTTSGQPNVDSGSGTAIAQPPPQAPPQAQRQQTTPGPVELQNNDPVTNPPQNEPALQERGKMMMKIHDTLLANGQFDAANKIQKAELDNIFAIAKISPQGAMKAWNSNPWITKKYGQVKPGDITQKGEWSFMKIGGDGLVRWNKNGTFEMVQKPTAAGGKVPTPQMYVEKPIGPNMQQKFQWNPQTGNHDVPFGAPYRIHKPDGGGGSGGDGRGSAADTREFRMHLGQLNGLYKSMAGIQKGVDPITQQIIPQDQIEAAKATIQGQINSLESLMQEDYPDHWVRYRKQPKAGGAIGGNGKQDYKANKTGNISKAADYFRDNAGTLGQKAMYDKLIAAGYSEDSIKQGWKQFKGVR
jgi:hypothetical protein